MATSVSPVEATRRLSLGRENVQEVSQRQESLLLAVWVLSPAMGLCTESDDCPVLESTERVKTGHAKKFSSKIYIHLHQCEISEVDI